LSKEWRLKDAVAIAKKGQKTPAGYYNLAQMLKDPVESGANIRGCGTCLDSRGIEEEELIGGIAVGKMLDLARWAEESAKVIVF